MNNKSNNKANSVIKILFAMPIILALFTAGSCRKEKHQAELVINDSISSQVEYPDFAPYYEPSSGRLIKSPEDYNEEDKAYCASLVAHPMFANSSFKRDITLGEVVVEEPPLLPLTPVKYNETTFSPWDYIKWPECYNFDPMVREMLDKSPFGWRIVNPAGEDIFGKKYFRWQDYAFRLFTTYVKKIEENRGKVEFAVDNGRFRSICTMKIEVDPYKHEIINCKMNEPNGWTAIVTKKGEVRLENFDTQIDIGANGEIRNVSIDATARLPVGLNPKGPKWVHLWGWNNLQGKDYEAQLDFSYQGFKNMFPVKIGFKGGIDKLNRPFGVAKYSKGPLTGELFYKEGYIGSSIMVKAPW